MKLTDNISNLQETVQLLESLNDPEFITEQGLSEDDISVLQHDLMEKIQTYKSEISDYVVYKTKQMQEDKILLAWTEIEIDRLSKLSQTYKTRIGNWMQRIDTILKTCGIDKLETPVCKLSYRKSEAVVLLDWYKFADEYIITKEVTSIDKMKIKEVLKAGGIVEWAILEIRQNLQFK